MTHTPGPWEDSPNAPGTIISTDKRAVSEWVGDGTGYMEQGLTYYGGAVICESVRQHDKPLLKAAPDLLDALEAQQELERCRARCFTTGGADSDYEVNMNAWHEAEEKAQTLRRAAIAKARGQSPKRTD